MKYKEYRHMKVYDLRDNQFNKIPVITLKGKWLEELGFERGMPITVHCEDGVLTITRTDELDYDDVPHEMPVSMVAESRAKYNMM